MLRLAFSFFVMLAFLPHTVAAQYGAPDQGQYTIVSAQYGTAEHHVDVTNRLKQLASQDRRFIMDNRTFGVDPHPGRVKVLRIYATDFSGRERMFEYPEHSPVDGAMFRGWNTGQWGDGRWSGRWEGDRDRDDYGRGRDAGQYVIQHAEFGTKHHHVDVTDRLRDLARRDMSFRMDNRSLGVDPDPGRVKTLRIYARGPDGHERTFDYREGSVIDGATFRGWQHGDWDNDRRDRRWNDDDDRRR
jgi:hypothetical protein